MTWQWLTCDLEGEHSILGGGHRRLHRQDEISQRISREPSGRVGEAEKGGEGKWQKEEAREAYDDQIGRLGRGFLCGAGRAAPLAGDTRHWHPERGGKDEEGGG